MLEIRWLVIILFAATTAFASCPSSVPSGITTCFYADFASGADTNNGTSEVTPWKHFPGMTGCTSNCNTNSPAAGDGYIMKGGVTWTSAALPWDWNWSGSSTGSTPGCTGSGCIYIGVDPTWFTGASWARPILNGGGSGGNANNSTFNMGEPGNFIVLDSVEFTGFYWSGTPGFGTANVSLPGGSPNIGAHDTFNNLYIHGWTHGTYPGTVDDACGVVGDTNHINENVGSILENSVISGADTDQVSCNGAVFGGPPYIANNVMEYVSSCMIIDGIVSVHDNICQNTAVTGSFETTAHENVMEINYDGQASVVYNNLYRHVGEGALTFWLAPDGGITMYVFNNVAYDTQDNNIVDIAASLEGTTGTTIMWNNTIECGPDSGPPSSTCVSGISSAATAVTFANNHWITSASPFWTTNGPTPTLQTNLLQSKATANGQGYTASQTEAFSPTSAGNSSVLAGTNKQSLCSTVGGIEAHAQTACENSTGYACSYNTSNHTVSCPAITPVARPSSTVPDIGAYEFTAGSTPVTSFVQGVSLRGVTIH